MKLWKKTSFYMHNWFWCQLHGIDFYHLKLINGSFMRRTANCSIMRAGRNRKLKDCNIDREE